MKRITIRNITALQVALLWEKIEKLTNWRVGWNKYNRKQSWISIHPTIPQNETAVIRFGNLSPQLLSEVIIFTKQLDIVDNQIEIEDE